MSYFVITGLFSYLIGGFFVFKKRETFTQVVEFLKGYLTMFFAGLYLHSGLIYLFSSMGVLAGHTRPFFKGFRGDTTEALALGIIFYLSWKMGLILFFFFLVLKQFVEDYDDAVFITSLLIPTICFRFFRTDSFNIICIIIFVQLAIQFWPNYLEKRIKSAFINKTVLGLAVFFILALFFFNKYVYKGFGMQKDLIRHGPGQFKYVAITFDDGPDPLYTPEILDILLEKRVPATFFLIGKNVESYPDIARRIVKEGHSVGNHTYSHKSLIPLSAKGQEEEIKKCEKAIEEVTGVRPLLFRPPRGVYTSFARKLLKDERYTIVLWDVSAMDWAELPPDMIVERVVKSVKPGSIILFHDSGDLVTFKGGNRTSTVQALPRVIDELKKQGYEFVTVDQMIFLSELMETEERLDENKNGGFEGR